MALSALECSLISSGWGKVGKGWLRRGSSVLLMIRRCSQGALGAGYGQSNSHWAEAILTKCWEKLAIRVCSRRACVYPQRRRARKHGNGSDQSGSAFSRTLVGGEIVFAGAHAESSIAKAGAKSVV